LIKAIKQKFGSGYTTELDLLRDAHSSLPVAQKDMVSSSGVKNAETPGDEDKLVRIYSINADTGVGPTALHVPKSHPLAILNTQPGRRR
ncbi:unnamed protein product, partial [marine sediment metagenome]